MNKTNDLILNAFKYYDHNSEKMIKLLDKAKFYSLIIVEPNNELEQNVIVFYDKNKKEFFRSKYELMGYYNMKLKIWAWGWVINDKKSDIVYGKKLLNYALDLGTEYGFLKSELVTSRSRVSSDIQIDIHTAIASYITKNPFIFKLLLPIINSDFTENGTEIFQLEKEINPLSEIHFLYILDEYTY